MGSLFYCRTTPDLFFHGKPAPNSLGALKRGKSYDSNSQERIPWKKVHLLPLSIVDLPADIFFNILLKLSTKSIISCKYVCKTWCDLISSPQFVKLHLAQARSSLLILDVNYFVVESEDARDLDLKYCWCEPKCNSHCFCKHIRVSTKLKVPMCKTRVMLNNQVDSNLRSHNRKYRFVNSCNGLVCLVKRIDNGHATICNPTTGEFIILPRTFNDAKIRRFRVCGLGFNPRSNEYKVVRTFRRKDGAVRAEIHTLGTSSWKSIGSVPHSARKLEFPTYLEAALHWIFYVKMHPTWIVSFDFDTEKFEFHPIPAQDVSNVSIGVLEGCLCVCGLSLKNEYYYIDIWVMKKNGDWQSWTKLFSIKNGPGFILLGDGCYLPIYSSNGALLLYRHSHRSLFYYKPGWMDFKLFLCRDLGGFQLITHTSSFVSLKDIVTTANVNSMYG